MSARSLTHPAILVLAQAIYTTRAQVYDLPLLGWADLDLHVQHYFVLQAQQQMQDVEPTPEQAATDDTYAELAARYARVQLQLIKSDLH